MITKDNFKALLQSLGFTHTSAQIFTKSYGGGEYALARYTLKADFNAKKLIYPANTSNDTSHPNGIIIHDDTTSNFSHPENFVVFECVHRLLEKGYNPAHIELEPRWNLGRDAKGGKADILVRDNEGNPYLLIECKTTDSKNSEFRKEWARMQNDGGQLFSYFQQERGVKFLCLYTSDFVDNALNYQSQIIATQDNQSYLKENSLTGYAHATNATELYEVWKEVYKFDFSTIGIFERNINAYQAGQNALCFEDLQELSSYKDEGKTYEDGKYHEFAKILRKYNISGKENAFDKLVNLFLCKIYDESHNKHNLQFCYRGVTSDSFEAMQDRLMLLYKEAMKEFLNEDITYISDEQIETQFSDFKRHKIKTKHLKEQMQEFIRQLKFYSHSDFSFLEVHNKKLFYQNGEVLKAVVKLFESLKLTQNKTNQLLGNLFELFLQKGMKQDEGQFFTPMPICEFIIHSLPLESMLKNSTPKVIDYACGAGHFLNTYANTLTQILPNDRQKGERLDALFGNIYGIEKEYRLSKVAKVAAAMFSQEKIHITYADALDFAKFPHDDFDILLSNPPYSVKGFAETLSKDSYAKYELSQKVGDTESFNAIECFFIERANALLSSNASLAIILPSSILNKGGIYENTREIILRNFDIIAIVELGSGTFGATGTNTIILFATKRQTYATSKDSQSYLNLKENIADSLGFDNVYLSDFLRAYCAFMSYDEGDFRAFLGGTINENLSKNFSEYKKAFLESSELANLQKSKIYKDSNGKDSLQEAEFVKFTLKKEKEKILYFSLSYQNKVLIIKSPNDNKEQKKFLGYEWSNRKGDEGLKELNIPYTTPLFERENPNNPHKINTLIKNAFLAKSKNLTNEPLPKSLPQGEGLSHSPSLAEDNFTSSPSLAEGVRGWVENSQIPKELEKYAFKARLVDMIDFSRADFSKAINLNSKKATKAIESKFEIVKLESVGEFFMGGTPSRKKPSYWNGNIKWLTIGDYSANEIIMDTKEKITQEGLKDSSTKLIPKGAVVVSIYATIGRVGILGADMATNQAIVSIIPNNEFNNKYLMYVIDFYKTQLFDEAIITSQKNINLNILQNMKIPKPPLEIQKQIVAECQKVESQSQNINNLIALYKDLIRAILGKCGISDIDAPLPSLRESTDTITALLDLIIKGESNLDFEALCHSEGVRSTTEESKTNFLDTSAFAKPQYDKNSISSTIKSDDFIDSPSLSTSGALAWVKNLTALLKSLPTPPKNGWERAKLGDIAFYPKEKISVNLLTAQNYVGVDNLLQNKQGKVNASFILENGSANAYLKNDILLGNIRPYLKKIWLADIDGGTNGDVVVVRCKDNKKINYKFLHLILSDDKFFEYEMQNVKGLKMPRGDKTAILKYQLNLPPLSEQNKIIAPIEWIESKITTLDSTLHTLESQKAKILEKYLF